MLTVVGVHGATGVSVHDHVVVECPSLRDSVTVPGKEQPSISMQVTEVNLPE